jgi:outer membrane PBP1 activator LpoA protein
LSKLNTSQKQQLKDLVIDPTLRRLTSLKMARYVQDKMQITISQDYLKHVKSSIRKDTKQTFTNLRKDIDLYINSIFFDRVEELRHMQKILHEVIDTNADNGEIQIKAVAQLQSITNELGNLFYGVTKDIKS